MFRNYFISALRSFLNNKTYSIIYLIGLALGITSCLIIFLLKQLLKANQQCKSTGEKGLSPARVETKLLSPGMAG